MKLSPTPTWHLCLTQTCALMPSSLPALWSTGWPAGCPRDMMLQINTFIFLRKSEPPPSPAGAGRVLCVCPLARRGPHLPTASVNTILNKS